MPPILAPQDIFTNRVSYGNIIHQLRGVFDTNTYLLRIKEDISRPVTPRIKEKNDRRLATVDDFIQLQFAQPDLTLIIRKDDFYIVGWYTNSVDRRNGTAINIEYGDNPISEFQENRGIPENMWGNVTPKRPKVKLGYGEDKPTVGPPQLQDAINTLFKYQPDSGKDAEAKKALDVLAVVLAEASRFSYVLNEIDATYRNGSAPLSDLSWETVTSWRKMTTFLLLKTNKETPDQFEFKPNFPYVYCPDDSLAKKDDTKTTKPVIAVLSGSGIQDARPTKSATVI